MRFAFILLCAAALSAEMRPAFNARDLDGWVQEGPLPTFSAANGELVTLDPYITGGIPGAHPAPDPS